MLLRPDLPFYLHSDYLNEKCLPEDLRVFALAFTRQNPLNVLSSNSTAHVVKQKIHRRYAIILQVILTL